jgi:hypothetical protein
VSARGAWPKLPFSSQQSSSSSSSFVVVRFLRHQRNIEGLIRSAVIFCRGELPRSLTDHENDDDDDDEDEDEDD